MRKIFIFMGMVFLLLTAQMCQEEKTADELAIEGWQKFVSAQYSDAKANFEAAISKDSTFGDAKIGIGWVYIKTDYSKAADYFRSFLDVSGYSYKNSKIGAVLGLASFYVQGMDIPSGKKGADEIIELLAPFKEGYDAWTLCSGSDITIVDLHNLLALAYHENGADGTENDAVNSDTAWGQVKKALELNSDNENANIIKNILLGKEYNKVSKSYWGDRL